MEGVIVGDEVRLSSIPQRFWPRTIRRLGIPEYFVFDRDRLRIYGYQLEAPGAPHYRPIIPQRGFYTSHVLGLNLVIESDRLRFFAGSHRDTHSG